MKKFTYNFGIISIVLVYLGSLFKLMHWPLAGWLFTFGMVGFILIFVPFALVNNYKTAGNKKELLLYIVIFLVALLEYGGALFKVMHWPGASLLMIIAIPFPFLVFVPVYLYITSKDKSFSLTHTVVILLFIAYMGVTSALLALGYSKNIIDEAIMMEDKLVETSNQLTKLNSRKASSYQLERVQQAVNLVKYCDDLKAEIIQKQDPSRFDREKLHTPGYLYEVMGKDKEEEVATVIIDNMNKFAGMLHDFHQVKNDEGEPLLPIAAENKELTREILYKRFTKTPLAYGVLMLSNIQVRALMKEKQILDSKTIKDTP